MRLEAEILPLCVMGVKNQEFKGMRGVNSKRYCHRQSGNPRTSDLQTPPDGSIKFFKAVILNTSILFTIY